MQTAPERIASWTRITLGFLMLTVTPGPACQIGSSCDNECDPSGAYCDGSVEKSCSLEHTDECPAVYRLHTGSDCDKLGADCVAGWCVDRELRCPDDTQRFCVGDELRLCVGDQADKRVAAGRTNCSSYDPPLPCMSVTGSGSRQAACAIDSTPCVGATTDCRDGDVLRCEAGYPIRREPCPRPHEQCSVTTQHSTVCGLRESCLSDGRARCDGDVVYGCPMTFGSLESRVPIVTPVPIALRDCEVAASHCVSTSRGGFCSKSEVIEAPATVPAWRVLDAGTFYQGFAEEREKSPRNVASFAMLEHEVTVAEYLACVDAHMCSWPGIGIASLYSLELPMVALSALDAQSYCNWIGGRLPSYTEFEYAARNQGNDVAFPWGNEPATCERAVVAVQSMNSAPCNVKEPQIPCSRPDDRTAQGVCDLIGNVKEWVVDEVANAHVAVQVGAAFGDPCASCFHTHPKVAQSDAFDTTNVGFRCVKP
jgi:hypothetical protein